MHWYHAVKIILKYTPPPSPTIQSLGKRAQRCKNTHSLPTPDLVHGPVPHLTLLAAVPHALALALEQVAGLAAHGAELVEGVDRAVSPEEADGLFALVDGCRDKDDALEVLRCCC